MNLSRLSVTQGLILVNTVVFLLGMFFQKTALFCIPLPDVLHGAPTPTLEVKGAYSWFTCFMMGEPWRLITYQFLHGGFVHLLFNMWALYFFGPAVERVMGSRLFLIYYLVCGVGGALTSSLLAGLGVYSMLMQGPGTDAVCNALAYYAGYHGEVQAWQMVPMIGASAAVYGVMVAASFLYPNALVELLIPPVTMTLRTFAWVIIGISVIVIAFNLNNAGGEAGHLGGIAVGAVIMLGYRLYARSRRGYRG